MTIRERLHNQIDSLPDEIVRQIADFTMFLMAKQKVAPNYEEWEENQWNSFALAQFFTEDEEIEYSLDDAEEVFRP